MILQKLCCTRSLCQKWYMDCGKRLSLHHKSLQHNYLRSYRNCIRDYRAKYSEDSLRRQFSRKGSAKTPFEHLNVDTGSIPPAGMWKPFIFTITFSTGSFLVSSVWEYESIRSRAMRAAKGSAGFSWLKDKFGRSTSHSLLEDRRRNLKNLWNQLSPGEKVFTPICLFNILVFALWRIPRLQPFMVSYFCSNPIGRAVCWPMFLSTFSHYSMFHILANMYVLHSFSNAAVAALGQEQFIGLYLSAGVVSTLASYFYKMGKNLYGPSLGASGAIMSILALVCTEYPGTQLSILFLPNFTFSAGSAIQIMMGIDFAGCILGWKFFDHAAHLGGAIFGLFWYYVGSQFLWPQREFILQYWHQLRSKK